MLVAEQLRFLIVNQASILRLEASARFPLSCSLWVFLLLTLVLLQGNSHLGSLFFSASTGDLLVPARSSSVRI